LAWFFCFGLFGVGSIWKGKELQKGKELLKGNCWREKYALKRDW
jgi:hypothetical protein